ncbi:MAG: hypothetical protein COS67_13290, partial [Deltaproteobacteria bacterium CG06_land_8_20_14_3_00_44_19]
KALQSCFSDSFSLQSKQLQPDYVSSHEDRRKELGKMLMDIAKYLATVGFIGSLLTDKLSVAAGISIFAAVIVLVVISFYTIPPKKGDR